MAFEEELFRQVLEEMGIPIQEGQGGITINGISVYWGTRYFCSTRRRLILGISAGKKYMINKKDMLYRE